MKLKIVIPDYVT